MFSTGPMFLTVQYSLFPARQGVGVIPADVYGKYDFSGEPAFYHLHGSSWHADDAAFIFWAERHKPLLVGLGGLAALAALGVAMVRCGVLQPRSYRLLKSTRE